MFEIGHNEIAVILRDFGIREDGVDYRVLQRHPHEQQPGTKYVRLILRVILAFGECGSFL